jgi:site-specific recombinase XerD
MNSETALAKIAKILPIGGQPTVVLGLPRYLTQAELARFMAAVRAGGSYRDFFLFGLMYRLALRVGEASGMLLSDLDEGRQRVQVRRLKGGRPAEYPLPRDLVAPARRYLHHERQNLVAGPFLFASRESTNQRGMTTTRIHQLFKQYAKHAELEPHVATHSLRHSIAVHSLEAGFGLEYVADLLGHRSSRSTAIYAQVTSKARVEMMQRLDDSPAVVAWRWR